MVPDQFSTIEEKLGIAWKFLTGEARCFRFFEGLALHDVKEIDRRIVLPMSLQGANHLAATVLLMDREDAEHLAATMFGVSPSELSESDIADACREACNVLSGAIVEYLSTDDPVDIGIPDQIGAARYQSVLNASSVKAYSEGSADNHHLMLVLFDPLIGPTHQEGG